MKALKNLGMALLGCMVLVTFNANAQTQNVPVSCSWVQTGSQSGPYTAIITFQCKESTGSVAATRSLTYSAPSWAVTNCSISLASGVFNSGSCQSVSLYRKVATTVSQCQNPGKYVGSGCAASIMSSDAFGAYFQQQCGTGCTPRTESLGFINGCYSGPPNGSPYINVYCQ